MKKIISGILAGIIGISMITNINIFAEENSFEEVYVINKDYTFWDSNDTTGLGAGSPDGEIEIKISNETLTICSEDADCFYSNNGYCYGGETYKAKNRDWIFIGQTLFRSDGSNWNIDTSFLTFLLSDSARLIIIDDTELLFCSEHNELGLYLSGCNPSKKNISGCYKLRDLISIENDFIFIQKNTFSKEWEILYKNYADMNNDAVVDARDASLILTYAADCGAGNFSGTLQDWILAQN